MFRSYSAKDAIVNKAKSSIEKRIREEIVSLYPRLYLAIDDIWPKKGADVMIGKVKGSKIQIVAVNKEVVFFQPDLSGNPKIQQAAEEHKKKTQKNDKSPEKTAKDEEEEEEEEDDFERLWYPTLRVLHQYPSMMPKFQVDAGAIKFVLRGADIMCPGLTHLTGGAMEMDVPLHKPVQITAEGKENACAVGLSAMSAEEIKSVNAGIAVWSMHSLDDGLWKEGMITI